MRAFIAAMLALLPWPALAGAQEEGKGGVKPPVYSAQLPSEPEAIVAAFLVDHTAWNAFAWRDYDKTKDFTAAQLAYRELIDLYCGPDKEHQGLTFSSDPSFDPGRTEILDQREQDGRIIVNTRHTDDNGFVAVHDFAFVKRSGRWRLDEVYYYDDYGDEWLPSL